MTEDFKVGDKVIANAGGLGWSYRAEIEDIYKGRALLLPLEVPFTASSARTGHYKKRRRWVRLDRVFAASSTAEEKEMEATRATTGGLEPRFIIERTDGKPIDPTRRYSMVLDFSGADPHAVVAARAYADSIRPINPQLADDIEAALANPAAAPAQHRYAA